MPRSESLIRFVFLTLLLVTVAPALAQDTTGQAASQEVGEVQEIVGGQPAPGGKHRWIAALKKNGHFCGASLIADRWVLTAAHCVVGENPAKLKVWVGGRDLRRPKQGVTVKVKKIYIHPNYNDNTLRHDIALLELKKPIGAQIQPVQPATKKVTNQHAGPGKVATVSGWGALSANGSSPKVLHQVKLPVVSLGECNSPASYSGEIAGSQICAGLRQGGKDACYGDSGGPLWVSKNGKDHLVGIVSWGEGCARPRKYGVYTRVAAYQSWLASKMKGGSGGGGGGGGGGTGSPNSCRNACGGNAGNCWCDADCAVLGDCCADYLAVCDGGSQNSCTTQVCAVDPYCCNVKWDALCEDLAARICN